MLTWDRIERGFERFLELLRGDARVWNELERSRAEFFATAEAARAPGAERRHLEWFLLERPSQVLGAIPALAWQESWRAGLTGADGELAGSFLHSLPGAYEVTSLVPGEGVWVRDLFAHGEHPIAEAQALGELEAGDLLVGRLFPAGSGTFLLSPAVTCFRNARLLAAVRADLEHMRAARRGVLRVQQLELERLFHGAPADLAGLPVPPEARAAARAELRALGLTPADIDRVLARVRGAARAADGAAITEILNQLAFETGVDLSSARLILAELWKVERGSDAAAPGDERAGDARAALEAFDRGRAAGKDLEQLFRELERDLGVEGEEDGGDEEPLAPDFPGVVGAMVEEFLWEVEREQGPERARAWALLRKLGQYGRDIGVFDEFGPTRLLDFCARWLLDESGIARIADVDLLLEALEAFCRWCQERHALPLWQQFGPTLTALRASVPRHVRLRQLATSGPGAGTFTVVSVAGGAAIVRDESGNEASVALVPGQAELLRSGDLVRLARAAGGKVLGAGYPGELGAHMAGATRRGRSRGSGPRSGAGRSSRRPED